MTEDNEFLFLLILLITLFGSILLFTLLTRKAIPRVIEIFYEHNALDFNSAKTLRELGLERKDFLQRLIRPRDYNQYALKVLIRTGVIRVIRDERLYILEGRLNQYVRSKRNNPSHSSF